MIKTIKVRKTKNLSELIAHISVSGIKDAEFVSNYENLVSVDHSGQITTVGKFYNDIFTVKVEEEITEDTRIPKTATLTKDEGVYRSWNNSINGLKKAYPDALQIHAIVNGKLQLIWEAE